PTMATSLSNWSSGDKHMISHRTVRTVAFRTILLVAAAFGAHLSRAAAPTEIKVVVEAERQEYFVGEPLALKFGITNVTDKPIKVGAGGDYRGGTRAGRFIVTATDDKGGKAI